MVMMQTGEESCVRWDIPVRSLILRRLIFTLRAKPERLRLLRMVLLPDYSEEEATKILSEEAVTAIADVKMGDATATAWGCDLTYDYVKINADYRS